METRDDVNFEKAGAARSLLFETSRSKLAPFIGGSMKKENTHSPY